MDSPSLKYSSTTEEHLELSIFPYLETQRSALLSEDKMPVIYITVPKL
jgi:hypothetical protein